MKARIVLEGDISAQEKSKIAELVRGEVLAYKAPFLPEDALKEISFKFGINKKSEKDIIVKEIMYLEQCGDIRWVSHNNQMMLLVVNRV